MKTETNNRALRIIALKKQYDYCLICHKRAGSWYYDCHPSGFNRKRHGSGKIVKQREYKTWKHNRNKQYK